KWLPIVVQARPLPGRGTVAAAHGIDRLLTRGQHQVGVQTDPGWCRWQRSLPADPALTGQTAKPVLLLREKPVCFQGPGVFASDRQDVVDRGPCWGFASC